MNSCHQCETLISKYIEGELDYNSKLQIEKHLRDCQPCASKVNNFKVLRKNLGELSSITVSADFDTILRANIRIEKRRERHKRASLFYPWKVRVPIYGMSLALVVFVLIMVFSQTSNRNLYSPQAAMNPEWKNGLVIQQNLSSGAITVYSLDRESAIDVISQHTSKYLDEQNMAVATNADSSTLAVNRKLNNLSGNIYQTSMSY